ncbi:MAG: stalk domain-containing protein [Bacillota bacterium]
MKIKSRKLFAILVITMMLLAMMPMTAFAAPLTSVTATPASTIIGDTTGYAVGFTTATALPADGKIKITFPAGFNVAGATLISVSGPDGTFAAAVAAQTITITRSGGTAFAPGAVTVALGNIVNNLTAGAYTVNVETTTSADVNIDSPTASAAFTLVGNNATANRFASSYTVDTTSVVADGTATAKITVYVATSANTPVANAVVFAASERGATETFTPALAAITDASGKAEFTVKSNVKGSAKIAVSLGNLAQTATLNVDDLVQHLQGVAAKTAEVVKLIGTPTTINFTAAPVNNVALANDGPKTADGLTQMTLTATVTDSGGNPVPNVEVTFSSSRTGLSFDKATYTTNIFGQAIAKVTATKAATYNVTASSAGKTSAASACVFNAGTVGYNIELVSGITTPIAKGQPSGDIKFKVVDINGNKIANAALVTVAFTANKPSGTTATLAAPALDAQNNVVTSFTPDKVGTYEIRASIANGKYVLTTAEVKEMGAITGLTMEYKPAYLAHGASSAAPTLKYVDAEGVTRNLTVAERNNIAFSASNLLLLDTTTPIQQGTGANAGIVKATGTTTQKGKVTITAVDTVKNLVATFELAVGTAPIGIALSSDAESYEVESDATVTVQLKDADGNDIAYGVDAALTRTIAFNTISKPAGSIVSVTPPADVDTDLETKGNTTFKVTSNKEGAVVVQIIVGDGVAAPNTKYITGSITLNFAPPAPPPAPKPGAQSVTMFIGAKGFSADGVGSSMDVAPFIEGGRTFVPVRYIAEALGAEADWSPKDKAVEVVTLTRPDKVVTIKIGANTLEVKADGAVSTITMDTAAMIKNGRTFLPFRFIAEAFGAEVDFGPKTGAIEWVTFKQ